MHSNGKKEQAAFDMIGDVHGCFDELLALLRKMEYQVNLSNGKFCVSHPLDRKVIFLGDLVDRGPKIKEVLHLAMDMAEAGSAFCVLGNHEEKLLRKLRGRDVQIKNGLEVTLAQLKDAEPEFLARVESFLAGLSSYYLLDKQRVVVAHAGLKEDMQDRPDKKAFDFALYGERTGKKDEAGLPIRGEWMKEYQGSALVVYGHTPTREVLQVNNTLNVDTGCVFGGKLTAYRYPEGEVVESPALKAYAKPRRPILGSAASGSR